MQRKLRASSIRKALEPTVTTNNGDEMAQSVARLLTPNSSLESANAAGLRDAEADALGIQQGGEQKLIEAQVQVREQL